MAHKMFERAKKMIALQAPTRNISAPASSLGRSARDVTRSYAAVGVLAAFVAGVASPAVLAGTEQEVRPSATHSASAAVSGSTGSESPLAEKSTPDGDAPTGGGAPAPRSSDPAPAGDEPAESIGDDAGKPAEAPAAPAAAGGGAQPAAPAPAPAVEPVDQLDGWIRTAIDVMQEHGVAVSEADISAIRTVIEKESSGDPNAINLWDINAQRGTPSKGLMQTIDTTFAAHKLPGYDNIYDPVSNIIAGTRYTLSRYGSFAEHPGLASMAGGSGYRGY